MEELTQFIQAIENEEFYCDIKKLYWKECIKIYTYNIKKFLIKDDNFEQVLQ